MWVTVDAARVLIDSDGRVTWEHDTPKGYRVPRHQIAAANGQRWSVITLEPLTLSPSLFCDPARGGCGAHVGVSGGHVL